MLLISPFLIITIIIIYLSRTDSEWTMPQLDGMMGEDTDEDDGAVLHDDGGGNTEEDEADNDQMLMMQGGDGVDHLVSEDGDDHQQQQQQSEQQQLDMSLDDLQQAVSADGDLMDTTDQLIDQSLDDSAEEDHKDMLLLAEEAENEVKSEVAAAAAAVAASELHHEGELLAAELLQQMHDQKPIIKEEEQEEEEKGAGLLDTLAQAAALQKVVSVVTPQPQKKPVTPSNSNSIVGNNNHSVKKEESSGKGTNAANKWYTVGVIQGLTHTVAHFFDWTCDEEGATRNNRRRRSSVVVKTEDGVDKKRRLDGKNGSNGTATEEDLGGFESDGEDTMVAMYNNQPLTLDNLPDLTGMKKMNLEPGTGYRFRIAAINNCGRGEWSEVSWDDNILRWLHNKREKRKWPTLVIINFSFFPHFSPSPSRPVCLVSRVRPQRSRSQRTGTVHTSAGSRHHPPKGRSSSTVCTWQ